MLMLAFVHAYAIPTNDNTLSGKITDKLGEPVPGALVSIPDLKMGTAADSTGHYIITDLPKGKYLVQVKSLGYSNVTATVTIGPITTYDVVMKESIVEQNEVVVTGNSVATDERKSVIAVQSVKMRELRENVSTNIIDAISKLPGISQLSTGPAISKPIIRGLGYNRIITINDGLRQEGQQWGDEHGIEIDDYNVSKVEVLKGPASLAYGSDALAGVINIISDEQVPEGKITGNVAANYQTNNGTAALHGQVNGNIKGINWDAYYTGKRAHDYQNKYDGYVFNSRFSNDNYGAAIGINKRWGNSKIAFSSYNQSLGISEGDRDSATGKFVMPVNDNGTESQRIVTDADSKSYSKQTPNQLIEHQKVSWNTNFHLSNGGRVGLVLGYQQNTRKEFGDVLQPDEAGLFFLLKTFSYDAKYFFPTIKGWQVTAGVNGMQQHNENKGIEFLVPDYKLFDMGVYGIARKEIGKWSISGGLRYNYRNIKGDALYLDSNDHRVDGMTAGGFAQFSSFSKSFSNVVGSVGTAYSISDHTSLKLNLATGYRAPNIAELGANGVHEGTIRYEYGNRALKAENSTQGDLGIVWNSDHVLVNAAVFYNYISNFIYIRKLDGVDGNDSIPKDHNDQRYAAFIYNQQNASLFGGELFVDLHPHPLDWLHFENTFSYVKGVFANGNDSTKNIPYIPAARWLPELKAQKKKLGKTIANAYVKAGLDVNFAQNNVFKAYNTETATQGYTILNAGLGFDIMNKKQKTLFTLSIAGQNLTDVAYQNHLSRLKYGPENEVTGRSGIYNVGRNVSFSLSVPLSFR